MKNTFNTVLFSKIYYQNYFVTILRKLMTANSVVSLFWEMAASFSYFLFLKMIKYRNNIEDYKNLSGQKRLTCFLLILQHKHRLNRIDKFCGIIYP